MTIIENTLFVNKDGDFIIPLKILQEMGLQPGDRVTVAYLSEDGKTNTYRELFIMTGADMEQRINLPTELLEQANLSGDLQIVCLNGCILICQDQTLNLDEITAVMNALDITAELFGQLDKDPHLAREQLCKILHDILKGEEIE